MWAGRGWNVAVIAGGLATFRNLRLVIAPQFTRSQNLPFPILPSPAQFRSPFASPFHSGLMSADLPLRFGDKPYTRIDPGETSVELSVSGLGIGASSAEQWWGPGFENAIIMSNNAAGIPRGYVRTSRPIRTRLGEVEGLWMLGGLTESPFFDTDPRNDLRALSAAVFTLRLAADTGLTIGAERSVYAAAARFGSIPEHLMDVFFDWHRAPVNGPTTKHSDQLTGLFARWVSFNVDHD